MKTVYKCENCNSVFNNDFNFCQKCLSHDTSYELKVEVGKRTDDMVYKEFIRLAKPIPSYESDSYTEYLWDNAIKYRKMIDDNADKYHVYTVIDDENKLWVVNGIRIVNRMGYIFTENYVEINEGIQF